MVKKGKKDSSLLSNHMLFIFNQLSLTRYKKIEYLINNYVMTSLLYISHSLKLTKKEKLNIDTSVLENRVAIIKFAKKVYVKGKVIVISTAFGIFILVSIPKNVEGIGVPLTPPAPIMAHSPEVVPRYARLTVKKQDKITFLKNERVPQSDQTYFDLPENLISTVDKIVELRGGDMSPLTKALFRLILIWVMS